MEKIKNFVALIPALLFVYCSGHIYYSSTIDLLNNISMHNEIESNHSLGAYLLSLIVEVGVIFKNIKDSQKLI